MESAGDQRSGDSPRLIFAARLGTLFAAAGNPTLQRVATAAEQRMRATRAPGHKGAKLIQRISDWRAGRNVPSRFETLAPVLITLIELARGTGTGVDAELLDIGAWQRLWKAAQKQPVSRPSVVNTLRRDIGTFIGRDAELGRILDLATPGQVVSIHTVDGMPGVGKTALVTRAAHLLADRFPDGQYFVELNAHTPGQSAVEPVDVLGTLLTDVGVDRRNLPETLAARRDMWRDRLTGKRVLLVLDDARDHDQIEALLPATAGCLTLVTSRRRLVALDGAAPVTLDTLAPESAAELFSTLSKRDSTGKTAEIVRLCGHLPLAIVLLAGRLAHHPNWGLTDVASEFAATRDRLDELEAGHRAVRAAFTTSYDLLPPERQRLFRRLGMHAGPDIDVYAVAALDDTSVAEARRNLEALYVEHLIDETAFGRYRSHDLVREYAQELIREDVTDRAESVERLVDYYKRTGLAAVGSPSTEPLLPDQASLRQPTLDTYDSAISWMRIERPNLLACLAYVAAEGQLGRAIELARVFIGEVRMHGAWPAGVAIHRRETSARDSIGVEHAQAFAPKDLGVAGYLGDDYSMVADRLARALDANSDGDPGLTATALRVLARMRLLAGEFQAAEASLRQARDAYRALGDRYGEAKALNSLGWVRHLSGDYTTAAAALRTALVVHREVGDRVGEAGALSSLGWLSYLVDDHVAAADMLRSAAVINRDLGRRAEEAFNWSTLSWIRALSGDMAAAIEGLRRCHAIYQEIGNRSGEAYMMGNIAVGAYLIGDDRTAIASAEMAKSICRDIENSAGEASALNVLGRVHSRAGESGLAADLVQRALTLYETIGNETGRADSLSHLGWIRHLDGDRRSAAELLNQALSIYRGVQNAVGEAETLNRIGACHAASGDVRGALISYGEALALARSIRSYWEEARALEGSARCRIHNGELEVAASELRTATAIYRRLGAAETDSAAACLAALEAGSVDHSN